MARPPAQAAPLSAQQRRAWGLGGHGAWGQLALEVEGRLEPRALAEALARVTAEDELLRTSYAAAPGGHDAAGSEPLPIVHPWLPAPWAAADLTGLPEGARGAAAAALLAAQRRAPAALDGSPLRAAQLILGPRRHLLAVAMPALAADPLTLENVLRAWGAAYARFGAGAPPPAGPRLRYAAYSAWQAEARQEEGAAAGSSYWRERLAGADPTLDLPGVRAVAGGRPAPLEDEGERCGPGSELAAACLNAAAARHGVTSADFLLTCWVLLLARLSGRDDLVVGIHCDGRDCAELRDAFGPYASCLPLRLRIDRGAPFASLLRAVQAARAEAESWQDYLSWPGRESDRFTAAFAVEDGVSRELFAGLPSRLHGRTGGRERSRVLLVSSAAGGRPRLALHHDQEMPRRAAAALLRRLEALIEHAARRPETPAARLDTLDDSERHRLRIELNATAPAAAAAAVPELLAAHAARCPHRLAVVCEDQQLTYAELERLAERLARRLRRRGVGPDVPVALCLRRSAATIVGLLAIWKAGGAYVPLEPDTLVARFGGALADLDVRLLLTERALAGQLAGLPLALELIDDGGAAAGAGDAATAAPAAARRAAAAPDLGHLAYVIFTSGSTGAPKPVGITHRNLASYVRFVLDRLLGDGRAVPGDLHLATVSTFAADLGHTPLFGALAAGGTLHVIGYERATDGARFAEYLARWPIDVLKIVPSHCRALLLAAGAAALPRRTLILGGEPLPPELAAEIQRLAPACEVFNHYGPTEATVGAASFKVPRYGAAAPASMPIGWPATAAEMHLLDADGELVGVEQTGEIVLGGMGIARGYLGQPGLTAERFVPDAWSGRSGSRVYRTGDLARRRPDGAVLFLGRADQQVKLQGYRVEPGEVQAVLRRHPAVRAAAVVVETRGGRPRLAAWVVPAGEPPEAAELRGFLAARLPEPMVPNVFGFLPALPLTANGKLDRRALAEPRDGEPGVRTAPRTAAERVLARIWSETLGVAAVSPHDNFFELGGDSILSMQIVARGLRLGLRLTVKQIFDHPVLAELADLAERAGAAAAGEPEPAADGGDVPLTPAQQRFFDHQPAAPDHFNMSLLAAVPPHLERRLLAAAVDCLLRRHDALRLRFSRAAGRWRQNIAAAVGAAAACGIAAVDLAALPRSRRQAALEAAAEQLQRSLSLASGPILRLALFEPGGDLRRRLLVVVHHLAVDAVSWQILLQDLEAAYRSLARGRLPELPDGSASFRRWARRLEEYAATAEARRELDYWLALPAQPDRQLPLDLPAGANSEGLARIVTAELTPAETAALLAAGGAGQPAPVEELLLTALLLAVTRWTGGRSLWVEMESHGREELIASLDLSRTVGWFTAHYPLRLDLGRAVAPAEALAAVRRQARQLPRRGVGYGVLRYLSGDAAAAAQLGELPAPQVGFNYLGQLDRALASSDLFAAAAEHPGAERGPGQRRRVLLGVHCLVSGGRLRTFWTYGSAQLREATVAAVAGDFLRRVRELLADGAAGRPAVPADFPEVDLSEEELARILLQVAPGAVEERGGDEMAQPAGEATR